MRIDVGVMPGAEEVSAEPEALAEGVLLAVPLELQAATTMAVAAIPAAAARRIRCDLFMRCLPSGLPLPTRAGARRGTEQPPPARPPRNARPCARARCRRESEGATPPSGTARPLRLIRLGRGLASRRKGIRAQAQRIQASPRVGGNVAPRTLGVLTATLRPWSPPKT